MDLTTLDRRDRRYPPLLAQLHDPPAALYVRGSTQILSRAAVAVVGARSCSGYGSQVARELARELAAAGVVVISGLARGIDGEAHRGALDADGPTVAVLGCGIDRDYPRSHADLAERIRASGAVVSEYPPGRAGAVAVSRPQSNHRRALPGYGGRGGAGALRRAHHGRLRARGRP